jgi:uncharacterized protein involved in tolerance to divalent cations
LPSVIPCGFSWRGRAGTSQEYAGSTRGQRPSGEAERLSSSARGTEAFGVLAERLQRLSRRRVTRQRTGGLLAAVDGSAERAAGAAGGGLAIGALGGHELRLPLTTQRVERGPVRSGLPIGSHLRSELVVLKVEVSAETQAQADDISHALLAARLVTGGQVLTSPSRFLWKGEVTEMEYITLVSFTIPDHKDAIVETVERVSDEEVPMIAFIPFEPNSKLERWIRETVA